MSQGLPRSVIKRYVARLDTACKQVENNLGHLVGAYPPEYDIYHNYVNQLGIMFETFHEMVQILKKKV